jgi:hypothetical protein
VPLSSILGLNHGDERKGKVFIGVTAALAGNYIKVSGGDQENKAY